MPILRSRARLAVLHPMPNEHRQPTRSNASGHHFASRRRYADARARAAVNGQREPLQRAGPSQYLHVPEIEMRDEGGLIAAVGHAHLEATAASKQIG